MRTCGTASATPPVGSIAGEEVAGVSSVAAVFGSLGRRKKALSMSIGIGKIVVELFSVAISVTVWR
jgi:hypothetical protein